MAVDFDRANEVVDGLSLDGLVGLFAGDNDPSTLTGEVAPTGSLFLRTTGELFIKTDVNAIDWTKVESAATSLWNSDTAGIYYDTAADSVVIGDTSLVATGTGGYAEGYKLVVSHTPNMVNGLFVRAGDDNNADIVFHLEDQDGTVQIAEVDAGGQWKLGHTTNPPGHIFSMDIRANNQATTDGTISTEGYRTTPDNGTTFSAPFFVGTLDGQEKLFLTDSSRANKNLSVETFTIMFSENQLSNNEWVKIGRATDALNGYIMPHNATIVALTAHTENAGGTAGNGLEIYVDNVIIPVASTFGATESSINENALSVDVNQNQKIRIRTNIVGSSLLDTVISLWIKWRL